MQQDKVGSDIGAARDRLRHEADEATRLVQEGSAAVKRQASQLAEGAMAELEDRGEEAKSRTAQGIGAFARAMRSAHEDMSRESPGILSDFVGEAATSLEQAFRSLNKTSAGDIVEAARDFGRRNPIGFIAASVLVGFAAARFVGSSAPRSRPRSGPRASTPGGVDQASQGSQSFGQQTRYGQSATTRGAL
jgi:hypothetical protein